MTATDTTPATEPDLLTINDLIRLTGWSRSKTYRAARADELPFATLRLGSRMYFSRAAYLRWLAGETTHADNGDRQSA